MDGIRIAKSDRISLWPLHVEGVNFLGAGVVHEQDRTIRGDTEPSGPRVHDAAKIAQADNLLDFAVGDAHSVDALLGAKAVVEVDKLTVRRPVEKTDSSLGKFGPLLGGEVEQEQLVADQSRSNQILTVRRAKRASQLIRIRDESNFHGV